MARDSDAYTRWRTRLMAFLPMRGDPVPIFESYAITWNCHMGAVRVTQAREGERGWNIDQLRELERWILANNLPPIREITVDAETWKYFTEKLIRRILEGV